MELIGWVAHHKKTNWLPAIFIPFEILARNHHQTAKGILNIAWNYIKTQNKN